MRLFARILLNAVAILVLEPTTANAFPILGFIGGALASIGLATPLIGIGSIAAVNAGFAFGAFLGSGFGSLLLSVGIAAAQYLLSPKPKAPTVESARINVRISEPERWLHGGMSRAGGAVIFAEYAANGDFWYIVVHGDSELLSTTQTICDEIPVTIDTNSGVTTLEFTNQAEDNSPVFYIYTRTFTPDDLVPDMPAGFLSAFPAWTTDHKLAGTCFSVIKCAALGQEDRYGVMNWRGPIGLGEPAVSIVGSWSRMYDPRDEDHDIDDEMTWTGSRNPVIIWAWFRTHRWGRNKPKESINWTRVAEEADKCDVTVVDKYGASRPRYQCGISIPDSKERHIAEGEILLSADATIMFDETGLSYIKVGVWEEPTLTLSAKRDIIAMSSREAQDGETETDGVIVKYIDPEFVWIGMSSAPWKNPRYYVEGVAPRYLTVEILTCQNHNQAMRLAKAIGERSQPAHRLAPTVGLRGIQARRERIVDLEYDSVFTGAYEIATPVEIDEAGMTSGFGLVPINENRWTLLEGEEGDKPIPPTPITYDDTLPDPAGVVVSSAIVEGSDGSVVRLEITFDAPSRIDRRVEFQYRLQGSIIWKPMIVLMDDLLAYSDVVSSGYTYEIQGRTVTTGGRASDWHSYPDYFVLAYVPGLEFNRPGNSQYLVLLMDD